MAPTDPSTKEFVRFIPASFSFSVPSSSAVMTSLIKALKDSRYFFASSSVAVFFKFLPV